MWVFNTPEKRQESLEIQTPVMESIESTPSTSTSNNSKYGPRKPGSIISLFKTCLFWPKTPEKVTNKRARVVFTAVVSSKKWKEYYDKAEEDKRRKSQKRPKVTRKIVLAKIGNAKTVLMKKKRRKYEENGWNAMDVNQHTISSAFRSHTFNHLA